MCVPRSRRCTHGACPGSGAERSRRRCRAAPRPIGRSTRPISASCSSGFRITQSAGRSARLRPTRLCDRLISESAACPASPSFPSPTSSRALPCHPESSPVILSAVEGYLSLSVSYVNLSPYPPCRPSGANEERYFDCAQRRHQHDVGRDSRACQRPPATRCFGRGAGASAMDFGGLPLICRAHSARSAALVRAARAGFRSFALRGQAFARSRCEGRLSLVRAARAGFRSFALRG